jgi:seryl-tRNA synthetase
MSLQNEYFSEVESTQFGRVPSVTAYIDWLESKVDRLRQENERLRRQFNVRGKTITNLSEARQRERAKAEQLRQENERLQLELKQCNKEFWQMVEAAYNDFAKAEIYKSIANALASELEE